MSKIILKTLSPVLVPMAAAIIVAGCTTAPETPSSAAVTPVATTSEVALQGQPLLDAMAQTLQVNYEILANRGDGHCQMSGIDWPDDQKHKDNTSGPGNCFEAVISLTSPKAIDDANWAIYFSQTDPLMRAASGEFNVEHINGDLHKITPNGRFTGFKAGQAKTVSFIVQGINLTEAKIMPNYYVALERGQAQARVIDSTRLQTDPETGLEVRPYHTPLENYAKQFKHSKKDQTPLATAEFLYRQNADISSVPNAPATRILPTPVSMNLAQGQLDISAGFNYKIYGVGTERLQAAIARIESLGVHTSSKGLPVQVRVSASEQPDFGSYRLAVHDSGITVRAADAAGAFYGLQSLASLINPGQSVLTQLRVSDAPRYDYRGMHVDVARNFRSKQMILDLLDQMAAYKLNVLHLHMGEDEGWRLEIDGLPELTEVGSRRCHDPKEDTCLLMQLGSGIEEGQAVDGFYSKADYIELIKAAEARHIQVIPSFDMPGHSRAVIKAMEARYRKYMALGEPAKAEQYLLSDLNDKTEYLSIQFYKDNTINACMESPYAFLGKVIDEVKILHEQAGQPLTRYHIGADETAGAWVDSPICKDFLANNAYGVKEAKDLGPYFIERVAQLLSEKGIETAGWSDGLSHTDFDRMPAKVQSNIWDVLPWAGVAEANRQANHGWDVVLSTPDALYFDFPYQADPKEGGYYWASRHINTRKTFNFMPGNLPAMAEIYRDREELGFTIKDTDPLKPGISWAGISGQLWSETLRSDDATEYMVFPRLLALAERAWHKPSWELPYNANGAAYGPSSNQFNDQLRRARDADFNSFATVVGEREMAKLDLAKIRYRVPTPGAIIDQGMLRMNINFPGLALEYKEQGKGWQSYQGAVSVSGEVEVRARSADGQRASRSLWLQ